MYPDLWKHPAPSILDGCIQITGMPFPLAEWGSDFSIIDISDNTGPTQRVGVGEESTQETGAICPTGRYGHPRGIYLIL